MLNTQQVLELVVAKPDRSTCDMRFMLHIWDAFTQWCVEQLKERVGVKVLGFGEFGFRKDAIGEMEFFNPMFVMNESYARSHGLHDRRPKTQTAATENVELDMPRIARITSDLVGEIVTREFVENAIRDVIDRIGAVCADDDNGVIMVDFGFGRLVSENKSVLFEYYGGDRAKEERKDIENAVGLADKGAAAAVRRSTTGPRPGTAASTVSNGTASVISRASLAASGMSMSGVESIQELAARAASLGLSGAEVPGLPRRYVKETIPSGLLPKVERAPLQRPFRRLVKKAEKTSVDDLLKSHALQIEQKIATQEEMRHEEASSHVDALHRLRTEMVMDFELHEQRRAIQRALAAQQKEQDAAKQAREAEGRRVIGIDHWPFRTEEAIREAAAAVTVRQKQELDRQMAQKKEKAAFLAHVSAMRCQEEEGATQRHITVARDEAKARAKAMAAKDQSMEATMDGAFSRYEDYLNRRKQAADDSKAFVHEQKYLSDQAELLKQAEQRRRVSEMKSYLDRQMKDREKQRSAEREEEKVLAFGLSTALPMQHDPDPEAAAFVTSTMRKALSEQIEHKEAEKRSTRDQAIQQEKRMMDANALEIQQAQYRQLTAKLDTASTLNTSWQRQHKLKQLEAEIEKALI